MGGGESVYINRIDLRSSPDTLYMCGRVILFKLFISFIYFSFVYFSVPTVGVKNKR